MTAGASLMNSRMLLIDAHAFLKASCRFLMASRLFLIVAFALFVATWVFLKINQVLLSYDRDFLGAIIGLKSAVTK
jgi:hypothetical protein